MARRDPGQSPPNAGGGAQTSAMELINIFAAEATSMPTKNYETLSEIRPDRASRLNSSLVGPIQHVSIQRFAIRGS
jgi:hypothetical protein